MRFDIKDIIDEEKEPEENISALFESVSLNEEKIQSLEEEVCSLKKRMPEKKKINLIEKIENKPKKKKQEYEICDKDVSYYLDLLDVSEDVLDLEEFMPNKEDKDYSEIMNSIMMCLQKEFVFYNRMMFSCTSKDELNSIKNELLLIDRKRNLIREFMKKTEPFIELSREDIHIFYTKTSLGNVKLLNDIKKIPKENYDEFYTLFQSIQSGNLKNPKVISSNNRFYGRPFFEVKLNHARITFEVLRSDVVVITGAFVKKVQTSKKYNNTMINNKQLFLNNYDYLLENLDNVTFKKEQEEVTKQVEKILKKEV